MSLLDPNFMIIRVGDIKKNFKNSVLDRIKDQDRIRNQDPKKVPIWGYNSEKCCGLRPVSLSVHNVLRDWSSENNAYVLFLPNSKSPIVGIAKINISETRESTNAENGWDEPTAMGITMWDIQINIERFWDLSKISFDNTIFAYDTINAVHGRRLPQSSLLYYRETAPIYQYLRHHMQHIIKTVNPTYVSESETVFSEE